MPKRTTTATDNIPVIMKLPRDLVRTVDHYAIDNDMWRMRAFEHILREGLKSIGYSYNSNGGEK